MPHVKFWRSCRVERCGVAAAEEGFLAIKCSQHNLLATLINQLQARISPLHTDQQLVRYNGSDDGSVYAARQRVRCGRQLSAAHWSFHLGAPGATQPGRPCSECAAWTCYCERLHDHDVHCMLGTQSDGSAVQSGCVDTALACVLTSSNAALYCARASRHNAGVRIRHLSCWTVRVGLITIRHLIRASVTEGA